jgi:hypothetical protein
MKISFFKERIQVKAAMEVTSIRKFTLEKMKCQRLRGNSFVSSFRASSFRKAIIEIGQ